MRKIVVNDTNIFIDLLDVQLLDEFFYLPWEIHTTDFVLHELNKEGQKEMVEKFKKDGIMHIAQFDIVELQDIRKLQKQHSHHTNVSLTDCSVWYYAKKNQYELLTGDRKLRSSSTNDGIKVHGILYVFDALVSESIISHSIAVERIKELQNINPRLPKDEIEKRLKKWTDNITEKGGSL